MAIISTCPVGLSVVPLLFRGGLSVLPTGWCSAEFSGVEDRRLSIFNGSMGSKGLTACDRPGITCLTLYGRTLYKRLMSTATPVQPNETLICVHHGCRWRLDLIAALFGAVNGAVTDAFCSNQMELLNITQNAAIF